MKDEKYMGRALELAAKGIGWVAPNPMVGAVLVKDEKIIGEGYHERYGEPHAERNALRSCTQSPSGATMYVTLEPCCHYGKTPPCTEAILESGIRRVVIGSVDPNPLVAGKGIQILRENGIEVLQGMLQDQQEKLNKVFMHYIRTGMPFVTMKYAMTLDGKIATATGKSKWISGEESRNRVHRTRHENSGIMVGINTVLVDDPMLDCRMAEGKNGTRIICDTNLRIPVNSKIAQSAANIPTWIATSSQDLDKIEVLKEKGCKILRVKNEGKHIDLKALMVLLGEMKMDSILLEGGGALNFSALNSGIVNKVEVYVAPKIFGGEGAKPPVGGIGVDEPDQAFQLVRKDMKLVGEDLWLEYEVKKNVYGNC